MRTSATVAAMLLVAACGSSGDPEPTTTEAMGTTTTASPTTTAPDDVAACDDADRVLAVIEDALADARFVSAGPWDPDTADVAFDDRTNSAEMFRELQGLDCGLRMVQRTDEGDERLVVGAWTGERVTFVVQATDAPTEPFVAAAQFDLLIEWAFGEYIHGPIRPGRIQMALWAATLEGGESILVFADDYSQGATAKHWQRGIEPGDEDEWVSLDAERHGIEVLMATGARNVGIAELPELGSEIGYLQAVTPTGQIIEARVAPPGWIDPSREWHGRPVETVRLGTVDVYVSEPGPPDDADILTYDVAHLSFECSGHTWHVITGFGTTEELAEFVATLVEVEC